MPGKVFSDMLQATLPFTSVFQPLQPHDFNVCAARVFTLLRGIHFCRIFKLKDNLAPEELDLIQMFILVILMDIFEEKIMRIRLTTGLPL